MSFCISQNYSFHLNVFNAKKELISILNLDKLLGSIENEANEPQQKPQNQNSQHFQQVNQFIVPTTQSTPIIVETSEIAFDLNKNNLKTLYREDTENKTFHKKKIQSNFV